MILLGTTSAIDLVAERGAQIGPSMKLLSILDKKAFKANVSLKIGSYAMSCDNSQLLCLNTGAQFSCFENQGRFVTLKKIGHPAF